LISTSGARHHHPDDVAVARILVGFGGTASTVIYRSATLSACSELISAMQTSSHSSLYMSATTARWSIATGSNFSWLTPT
jgi:hypothetical protein